MKLTVTSTLTATAEFSLPGDGQNVWRKAQIKVELAVPSKQELEAGDFFSRGDRAVLDRCLVKVHGVETDETDESGNPLTAEEVVKRNHFAAGGVVRALLDALGRDTREYQRKNSK